MALATRDGGFASRSQGPRRLLKTAPKPHNLSATQSAKNSGHYLIGRVKYIIRDNFSHRNSGLMFEREDNKIALDYTMNKRIYLADSNDNRLGFFIRSFSQGHLLDGFIIANASNILCREEATPSKVNTIVPNEAIFKLPIASCSYQI